MTRVFLSRRALKDLENIEQYSLQKWGERVTHQYIKQIETAIQLINDQPQVLRSIGQVSPQLTFYRVQKPFLVCQKVEKNILILTIKHGSMDIPNRLLELEPNLKRESAFLYQKLLKAKKRLQ